MKFVIILAIVVVAVNAIPFKPNDMPKWIKKAEEDSSKNLNEFVTAFNEHDTETLSKLTNEIIEIAKKGQNHSIDFVSKFPKLLRLMKASSERHGIIVRALAFLIDGNRDNESYYVLETLIQWIEKRQEQGVSDPDLTKALAAAKASQEHLQNMAGTFVEGVKQIRKEPSNSRQIVAHIVKTTEENEKPFLDKYQEAMDAMNNFLTTVSI